MYDAGFYDETYFDGHGKSNYEQYTDAESPFGDHADLVVGLMHQYGVEGPVLDVGCAKGYLVRELRSRGVEAFGVDWSAYAIAHADSDVAPFVERASATDLPFERESFALTVSFDLLELCDETSAYRALVECARVSRWQLHQINTGRLSEWRYDTDESHQLRMPLERWREIADQLGLTTTVLCEPDRARLLTSPEVRRDAAVLTAMDPM